LNSLTVLNIGLLLCSKKLEYSTFKVILFLAPNSVGPLVVELDSYFLTENFFVALVDSAHSNCYSMKNWGGFTTLHCKCWSMDWLSEDSYSSPHSSLASDL